MKKTQEFNKCEVILIQIWQCNTSTKNRKMFVRVTWMTLSVILLFSILLFQENVMPDVFYQHKYCFCNWRVHWNLLLKALSITTYFSGFFMHLGVFSCDKKEKVSDIDLIFTSWKLWLSFHWNIEKNKKICWWLYVAKH